MQCTPGVQTCASCTATCLPARFKFQFGIPLVTRESFAIILKACRTKVPTNKSAVCAYFLWSDSDSRGLDVAQNAQCAGNSSQLKGNGAVYSFMRRSRSMHADIKKHKWDKCLRNSGRICVSIFCLSVPFTCNYYPSITFQEHTCLVRAPFNCRGPIYLDS